MRALILAAALALPAAANAATMTFDTVPDYGEQGDPEIVSEVHENGLRVTPTDGIIGYSGGGPGTVSLVDNGTGLPTGVRFDFLDGSLFSRFGFEVSYWIDNSPATNEVRITAHRGGSVVFLDEFGAGEVDSYLSPIFDPADQIELRLVTDEWCGDACVGVALDSASLSYEAQPVPIPATAGLLGAAVAGLGLWRRKRS